MKKNCVYCSSEILDERVIDICDRCGFGVWGPKMFPAILQGTNVERAKGNLELGRVSEN